MGADMGAGPAQSLLRTMGVVGAVPPPSRLRLSGVGEAAGFMAFAMRQWGSTGRMLLDEVCTLGHEFTCEGSCQVSALGGHPRLRVMCPHSRSAPSLHPSQWDGDGASSRRWRRSRCMAASSW